MKRYILCLILLLLMTGNCLADTVILKNKNPINGIIVGEDQSSIVLNVGCGTIALSRADIESVKRSDEATNMLMMKEWRPPRTGAPE